MFLGKHFKFIVVILLLLSYEYLALSYMPSLSLLTLLQQRGLISKDTSLSTTSGHPISWWLGVAGAFFLFSTYFYVLKKRLSFLKSWGTLIGWFDFHIFCGMIGPILIIFHANFEAGGLVAIGFWSMIISASSGIIGRYFYVQLSEKHSDLAVTAEKWNQKLEKYRGQSPKPIDDATMTKWKKKAFRYVGTQENLNIERLSSLVTVLGASLMGDLRLNVSLPKNLPGMPKKARIAVAHYALTHRRMKTLEVFKRLLGYWHTFHYPFAVFMYVTAIIHIASALLFGVNA